MCAILHGARVLGEDHPLRGGQQLTRVVEEPLPTWREHDVPAVADEQREAEVVLELADLLGQRRLADVQAGRGLPEVQLVGDGDEVPHQPEIQVHPVLLAGG